MGRRPSRIACILLVSAFAPACGGGDKPPPKKPVVEDVAKPKPKPETEEDREKKRRAAAVEIIPEGTTCLPRALKGENAPRLELTRVPNAQTQSAEPIVCAVDTDPARLLGAIACWKVEDFAEGKLAYVEPRLLPTRSVSVKLDDRCARGFCIPKEAKVSDVAHISLSEDGAKAVVVTGDDAHIFDTTARTRESGFTIRGDKGVSNEPRGVYWTGDTIFVHGADAGPASYVWPFKVDGTAVGVIQGLGGKDNLNIYGGTFAVLGKNKVLLAERGFSTATVYEVDTGKRSKMQRKVATGPCKPAEVEAFWTEGEVPAKCKDHMTKNYAHLIGADAILGTTNLLVLLRGNRLGELVVMDIKTLKEKDPFQLLWCEATADNAAPGDAAKPEAAKTRGAVKKDKDKKAEDPDQGGE